MLAMAAVAASLRWRAERGAGRDADGTVSLGSAKMR
jgi:hypothetical protein